jgi:prepilin-type N-terminal cleavage/methylation domain-containing protein
MKRNFQRRHFLGRRAIAAGFSLVELLVAMAVFLVVSAASFSLFARHETLLSQEQGITGLNIGLRNALSMLQIDVVNAGSGQIMGPNVPAWPVGVTIYNSNPTTSQCNPSATYPATYAAACFDQLNVVMVDPNTPPVHPQNSAGGCIDTSAASATLYGTIPVVINPATGLPWTVAQVAARFHSGDQVLFVTATGSPYKYTTALLNANGSVSTTPAGFAQLYFNSTLAAGGNSPGTPPANDPISMTVNAPPAELTNTFCTSDWVLRVLPIQYSVNVTNPSDPQLVRTQGGVPNVVMDQVIGFKVGAAWWNSGVSTFDYYYLTSAYNSDFTYVRSVRLTLIGRTAPSTDPTYTYRNPFDSGPYQIRGSSIVVNPRNLTMNND